MIFEYNSPLLKQQTKMQETILYILYNYRKSNFSDIVLHLLESLLEAAATMDVSGRILKFLLMT